MTTINQTLNNNTNRPNKKIYFDNIRHIRECSDGCEICQGYFISISLKAYSICECVCHTNLLTYQDIEPIILFVQKEIYYDKFNIEQNDLARFSKVSIFDSIDEIFSRENVRRCKH